MRLMYFAMVRERLGKSEEELDFSGSVSGLRQELIRKYPELEQVLRACRFAVNEEYVRDDFELRGDERVAVIPPVSGG